MTAKVVAARLREQASPARARASAWYFKTAAGQYGHGDAFIGVNVPAQRKLAKAFRDLPLAEVGRLLQGKMHEERLTALFILVGQYQAADPIKRRALAKFYLSRKRRVNNWDLVDSSAPYILGDHLLHSRRDVLYTLAASKNMWDRRIAMLATAAFIRAGEYGDTLKIVQILMNDREDLIHKAAGWMLREVGKRSLPTAERFLRKHAARMPRTMLRYAIEKLPESRRKAYLDMRRERISG